MKTLADLIAANAKQSTLPERRFDKPAAICICCVPSASKQAHRPPHFDQRFSNDDSQPFNNNLNTLSCSRKHNFVWQTACLACWKNYDIRSSEHKPSLSITINPRTLFTTPALGDNFSLTNACRDTAKACSQKNHLESLQRTESFFPNNTSASTCNTLNTFVIKKPQQKASNYDRHVQHCSMRKFNIKVSPCLWH